MNQEDLTPLTPRVPAPASDDITELVIWGSVALVVLVLFAIAVYVARRKLLPSTRATDDPTWTLQELNELHNDGRLSDAEYRVLRTRLIESFSNTDR